jgi:hypothetical protein
VGEQGIVPEDRVEIEREMGTVNGHVAVDGEGELAKIRAGEGLKAGPEKTVMDEEKVDAFLLRDAKGGFAGIDGGADARDDAAIGKLKAVKRVWPIRDVVDIEKSIDERGDVGEGGVH